MSTTFTNNEKCIDVCSGLLQGEISAIETYGQAIEKFSSDPAVAVLRDLRAEHVESANHIRNSIQEMGGQPPTDSGSWGVFARSVEGAATLLGEKSALKGLQQGEEYGLGSYESALEDDGVLPGCKQMIESELLPRQRQHIQRLQQLADAR